MLVHDISDDRRADMEPKPSADSNKLAREQAIGQIERGRRFWMRASLGTFGVIILAVIWALTEYHNAGGWPTNGFSQSSGLHDMWNYWIIYPAIAWVLITAGDAWWTFGRRPISEVEIKHEMELQAGSRR